MSQEPSLSNVLVAASLRADQWRQLNASARSWAIAGEQARGAARDACAKQFDLATRLEYCWAYPGERLLAALRDALDAADAALFARLVQKVSGALLSGDYRRDEAAWDATDAADRAVIDYARLVTQRAWGIRDQVFADLRRHFSEAQIVELTLRAALAGFFNRFNDALQIDDGAAEALLHLHPEPDIAAGEQP